MSFPRIVTISGPSGAGKTSIAKELLAHLPNMKLVVSLTTRKPRLGDLPGEYRYEVLPGAFDKSNQVFLWLWVVPIHGDFYGTLQESVVDALSRETPSLMILAPSVLEMLRSYAEAHRAGSVLSFYILPPDEEKLRVRLEGRGDNPTAIEKRIADCRHWNEEARKSTVVPYVLISNEEDGVGIKNAAQEILKHLV